MNLQYVFGDSGTGKFYHCVTQILERQNNNKKSILIIPEQFTMQAEKQIIEQSQDNVLFNTQVLNFKRLAYRIFSELGLPIDKPLEDIGQIMIIRKIIYKLAKEDKLKYFNENAYTNLGLLEKISIIIKEFSNFGIEDESLEFALLNLGSEKETNLISKLSDLKEIYSEYKVFMKKDYVTDEEVLELLYKKIDFSEIIDNDTHIYVYGFDEFNNQEIDILYKLFQKSGKVNIYFNLNTKDTYFTNINVFDNYFNIKTAINKIADKIIIPLGIKLDEVVFLKVNFRHKDNSELLHLQENFLSYKSDIYYEEVSNISIYEVKNKYVEIENVAKNILSIIKQDNLNFKDICVILGDSSYQNYLKMIFNKYNIPYFLDDKKSIANHSIVEVITSVIDIVLYNFQYDAVFKYLKSGYLDTLNICNINKSDINLIENYVLKYGIKGYHWKKPFTYGFYENSPYSSEKINGIRQNILDSLRKFNMTKTKKYTATEICTCIVDFMIDIKLDQTTKSIMERDKILFEKNILNNAGATEEYIQVFNGVNQILQKIVDLIGDEKMYLLEFSKIIKSAFEKQTISIIPPTQDQILIGNFDRTKISTHEVIFAVGINEGNAPAYKEDSPFISDLEKIMLHKSGIYMRSSSTTMIATDLFKIYLLLLKAKRKLILSYSTSTLSGKQKKPSVVITKMSSIFPNLKIQKIDKLYLDFSDTPEIIFENIFKNLDQIQKILNQNDDLYCDLTATLQWFFNSKSYSEKLANIFLGISKIEVDDDLFIDKDLIPSIYNDNKLLSSVSKLETFNKCPFAYFLRYNLNVTERDLSTLDYIKLGNIFHSILEQFSKIIFKDYNGENSSNLDDISTDDINHVINNVIGEFSKKEEFASIFEASAKYNYYLTRIAKMTSMSAEALIRQLRDGSFIPQNFEVNFSDINSSHVKIPLFNDFDMLLRGKIDRVDKMITEDNEYIKIVDYKSSDQKIEIEKVYHGIQLQLLMYLSTFMKIQKDISENSTQPAGAFYFQVQEAILSEEKDISKFNKKFDLKGIISNDYDVLNGFDKFGKNEGKKTIANISSSEILSNEEFEKLLKLSNYVTKKIGRNIVIGDIGIKPYKYKDATGCDYCEFSDVCNFDMINNESKYKCLKSFKKDELWNKINDTLLDDDISE